MNNLKKVNSEFEYFKIHNMERKMKKKKPASLMLTKETQEARKERVSCGVKYRTAVFENKKKQQKYKNDYNEEKI